MSMLTIGDRIFDRARTMSTIFWPGRNDQCPAQHILARNHRMSALMIDERELSLGTLFARQAGACTH